MHNKRKDSIREGKYTHTHVVRINRRTKREERTLAEEVEKKGRRDDSN